MLLKPVSYLSILLSISWLAALDTERIAKFEWQYRQEARLHEVIQYTPHVALATAACYIIYQKVKVLQKEPKNKETLFLDTVLTKQMKENINVCAKHHTLFGSYLGNKIFDMGVNQALWWAVGSIGLSRCINRYWFQPADIEWFVTYRIAVIDTISCLQQQIQTHIKQLQEDEHTSFDAPQIELVKTSLVSITRQLEQLYAYIEFSVKYMKSDEKDSEISEVQSVVEYIMSDLLGVFKKILDSEQQIVKEEEQSYNLFLFSNYLGQLQQEIKNSIQKYQNYMTMIEYAA